MIILDYTLLRNEKNNIMVIINPLNYNGNLSLSLDREKKELLIFFKNEKFMLTNIDISKHYDEITLVEYGFYGFHKEHTFKIF